VEAGLICIFIELRTLNEAKVSSYIQDILRHGKKIKCYFRNKLIDYNFLFKFDVSLIVIFIHLKT